MNVFFFNEISCTYTYRHIQTHIYRRTHIHTYFYLSIWLIGLVGRVFANGLRDLGSIPGRVIPKTLKIVLDISLLNSQQYKVRIKSKVEQSWERSSALGVVAIEKGASWLPLTTVTNFTFFLLCMYICMGGSFSF